VQALGRDPHYVVARVETDLRAEVGLADRQLRVRIAVERVGITRLTTRETVLMEAGVSAAEAKVVTVLWGRQRQEAGGIHRRRGCASGRALPPSGGNIAAVRGWQSGSRCRRP
jgi:hypothetical protein